MTTLSDSRILVAGGTGHIAHDEGGEGRASDSGQQVGRQPKGMPRHETITKDSPRGSSTRNQGRRLTHQQQRILHRTALLDYVIAAETRGGDPECAAAINLTTAPRATYQGKVYYFCTCADREEFLKTTGLLKKRGQQ